MHLQLMERPGLERLVWVFQPEPGCSGVAANWGESRAVRRGYGRKTEKGQPVRCEENQAKAVSWMWREVSVEEKREENIQKSNKGADNSPPRLEMWTSLRGEYSTVGS